MGSRSSKDEGHYAGLKRTTALGGGKPRTFLEREKEEIPCVFRGKKKVGGLEKTLAGMGKIPRGGGHRTGLH